MSNVTQNLERLNYFVVFPSYLLEILNHRQCVLLGVINSLANKKGYCYASNKALIEIVNTSAKSLERDLKVLESRKLIFRELLRDSNLTVLERRITPLNTPPQFGGNLPSSLADTPPVQNGVSNTDNSLDKNKKDTYSVEFEKIWNLYLKKGVKKTSYKAWTRLTSNQQREALAHIPLFIAHHQSHNKMAYLPHLATYLNQQRWENDLPYQDNANNTDLQWS